MSIEADLRQALLAHAPLAAKVGSRVSIDEVPETTAKPYLVFAKQSGRIERGLDNSVHAEWARIDIQCVGNTRREAIDLAGLVRDALDKVDQPAEDVSAGYDAENDLEVEVVTVEWLQ